MEPSEDTREPDYRFTLANERTFLAWIRTALALIAGGVAVVQLVPVLSYPRYATWSRSCPDGGRRAACGAGGSALADTFRLRCAGVSDLPRARCRWCSLRRPGGDDPGTRRDLSPPLDGKADMASATAEKPGLQAERTELSWERNGNRVPCRGAIPLLRPGGPLAVGANVAGDHGGAAGAARRVARSPRATASDAPEGRRKRGARGYRRHSPDRMGNSGFATMIAVILVLQPEGRLAHLREQSFAGLPEVERLVAVVGVRRRPDRPQLVEVLTADTVEPGVVRQRGQIAAGRAGAVDTG